ncbi:hypothetical protein DKM44_12780 [Deinococcus irradiatisoli]|uniref:Uncharacterized protein n=2 Tax=Deinococcus irradiatisoli TaxID=2202254 RepID=A0A2Z3JJ35_9DEIO|nr:hypothetical protein DKM44_12780 [Deinococcus irradiatisoli]
MLVAQPPTCTLTLIPDQVRGVAYHVIFKVAPSCPADAVFRVRKSSTINQKKNGAPYQPIKPLVGAWDIGKTTSTVPGAELWTSLTWQWQVYDEAQLNPATQLPGTWRRIRTERTP